MGDANIELSGYTGDVVESMIKHGYAKTKTEAIRLALYQFDQTHKLTEEEAYGHLAGKIMDGIKSGKVKTRKFNPSDSLRKVRMTGRNFKGADKERTASEA